MKLENKLVCHFLLAILCVSLTGCGTVSRVEQLGHGYEEVAYTHTSITMEPESMQITLQYRKPSGRRITVWPSTDSCIVNNDIAVFVGNAAAKQPNPDNSGTADSRLFAVKAPELPLNITDQVLQKYCEETGVSITNVVKDGYTSLKKFGNAVEIDFAILSRGERGPSTVNIHSTL